MFGWMFDCKEVSRLISESLDRELPIIERAGIRFHLVMCDLCAEQKRQFEQLRESMQHYAKLTEELEPAIEPSVTLSPEARERIRQALK